MGHAKATTPAPRAKGPADHPMIGHPWMNSQVFDPEVGKK